jgi:protein gp37
MSDKSAIEWTDATWNPIVGCSLVSPGCTNCYAMKMAARIEKMTPTSHYAGTTHVVNGKPVWTGLVRAAPDEILTKPLRWKKPRRIFVNSMSDLFHEGVSDEQIDRVFATMALAPHHTFQVLTKRSKRMREYFNYPRRPHKIARACVDLLAHKKLSTKTLIDDWPVESIGDIDMPDDIRLSAWPLTNVWAGVTAEDQRRADERRQDLRAVAAMGWTTFVSYEPALGPVDWALWYFVRQIIFGGETGPGARPPHPQWARDTRDFCAQHGIAYFHKQWGEWSEVDLSKCGAPLDWMILSRGGDLDIPDHRAPDEDLGECAIARVGKSRAGRLLDGREHNEFPRTAA